MNQKQQHQERGSTHNIRDELWMKRNITTAIDEERAALQISWLELDMTKRRRWPPSQGIRWYPVWRIR
jgi:hypothetical protein